MAPTPWEDKTRDFTPSPSLAFARTAANTVAGVRLDVAASGSHKLAA
jgi:hypothetical protein